MTDRKYVSSYPSRWALLLSLFMTLALLSGCGGGSSSANPNSGGKPGSGTETTPPAALPLLVFGSDNGNVGQTLTYLVTGGKPPYIVFSSAANVASVTPVTQLGLAYLFSATLKKDGSATLIVTDSTLAVMPKVLTVTLLPLKTTAGDGGVTLAVAEEGRYTITGGQGSNYSATSSNNSVATVSVTGSTLVVKAAGVGSAAIKVCDANCLSTLTVNVTVVTTSSGNLPFKTTAPVALTLGVGVAQTYTNSGGTAPYTCVSESTSVVTVACTGNGSAMTITGVADGVAKVTVTDASSPTNSATIAVNVASGTGFTVTGGGSWTVPVAHCSAAPYVAYDPPIYNVYFINGGKPPYKVSSGSPLVGSIIGTGSKNSPMVAPSGAKSVNMATFDVTESGGYFIVAWPEKDNNGTTNPCKSGDASFVVKDADGNSPTTAPTFKVTVQ